MLSCNNSQPDRLYHQQNNLKTVSYLCDFPYSKNVDVINVVEIDGCEYLVGNAFANKDLTITHKGNCKYCEEKQEKLFQNYITKSIDNIQ